MLDYQPNDAEIHVDLRPLDPPGFAAIVRLSGEHDLATGEDLRAELARLHGNVLVDLSDCEFIDSTVIAILIANQQEREREGQRLELLVPGKASHVARAIEVAGVGQLLTVRTSLPQPPPISRRNSAPRYRMTGKSNPSERFDDQFDDVLVSGGMWVFARNKSANAVGAGQTFGSWSVADYTVEVEAHGGTWREINPRERYPAKSVALARPSNGRPAVVESCDLRSPSTRSITTDKRT